MVILADRPAGAVKLNLRDGEACPKCGRIPNAQSKYGMCDGLM